MHFKNSIFVFVLTFGLLACGLSKNMEKLHFNEACKAEALKRYGNDTVFQYNPDSSYVLCSRKLPENNLNPDLLVEFFVIENYSCSIVYDDKISGAVINWYTNEELLIVRQKGITENDVDTGKYSYTLNVKTHKQKELVNLNSVKNIK